MQTTFTPAICKPLDADVPVAYRGEVTIRMPNFEERVSFYDDAGVAMDTDGMSKEETQARNRRLMRVLARRAREFFLSSTVERIEDGFKFDSFDVIEHDSEGMSIVSEIALKLISKFQVGKQAGNVPAPS